MCSNVYLTQVLERFESFGGVFACDELSSIVLSKKKILSIVVNTQPSYSDIPGHCCQYYQTRVWKLLQLVLTTKTWFEITNY